MTASPPDKPTRQALTAGLYRRFVIAFLLLGLVILGISSLRNQAIKNAYAQKEYETLQARSQEQLNILRQDWLKEARRTINELEFMRIDQLSLADRQTKLIAFFTAQGENRAFEAMNITDKDHTLLYANGCAALNQAMISSQNTFALVTCDDQAPALYYIIELPIWLGAQGKGYAHFAEQITPAFLAAMVDGNSSALIRYHNNGITSSDVSLSLADAEQQHSKVNALNNDNITFNFAWPDNTDVVISLYKILPAIEPWWMIFIPPLIVIVLALTIIWLVLGRWMQQLSVRINLLWSGVQSYAITQNSANAFPYLRVFQNRDSKDDIARLGRAIIRMMHDVDKAREHEVIFSETLALLEEAIITLDADNNLLETSSGWHRLVRLATPTGERFLGYIHPDDRESWLLKSIQLLEGQNKIIRVRFRLNTNQPASPWLEGNFLAHHDESGTVTIRGALRDVTQSYLQEQQITHMALHDALTGLANRILLEDRLRQSLLLCERNQQQLAVLFFDLDHFKHVNDALGHKVGDQLLIAISQRIASCLRASDTLARWGGDEFVILLPNISGLDEVRIVADKLMEIMQTPIMIDTNELPASFSIGAALYPDDGTDIQSLFSNADRAMFYAKSQGRNQAAFFADMKYKDDGKQELYIQNRLAAAIKAQKIQVYYQPIISSATGKVHAVEALARWHDEQYGWVSPATFIPMAENLGMICPIGEQVLRQAFTTLAQWRTEGIDIVMAINVSSRQLFAPSFVPSLMLALESNHLSTNHIIIEVTESLALRDVDHAMTRLQELQQQGLLIAIDDFGTGHSSLAQLQEINADKLKIDRAFIMRIEESKGHNMVKAVSNMAQALNLKTVAEGVETHEQKQLLSAMGIDYLQGFYFAKPMPNEECLTWIKHHA